MPEFIKKNWVFILAGVILIVLLKWLWPGQPEPQAPTIQPETTKTMQPQKPDEPRLSTAPSTRKQPPNVATTPRKQVEQPDEIVEQAPVEQAEENERPPNHNYVLCEHIISGETQYEFTGQIRLINKGTKPVYGWTVNWEYEDGSTIVSSSGVALSGNNPYTGQYLSENAEIPPGETVTFSFTGMKNSDHAPLRVNVTGDICM